MGFGASSRLHSDRIEVLSLDLPIVIECVETEEKIKAILPELDSMIGGGLITLERAKVILYRPHKAEEEGPDDWSLDVTGSSPAIQASRDLEGLRGREPGTERSS